MVFHHDMDFCGFSERISWVMQEHPWGHGKIESIGAVVAPWLGLSMILGPERSSGTWRDEGAMRSRASFCT